MAKKLGEAELSALVSREISLAQDNRKAAADKQTKALEYFQGVMKDIPPETGRSKAVSRDLADTMGWILPGIMRVFTASEHMAIAEPVGENDVEGAKQATDGINFTFWKENDGYRIVHSATWDSLLAGNGVVKTWFDDTPVETVSFHSGLDREALDALISDEGVEVLNASPGVQIYTDPQSGESVELETYSVKIKRTTRKGRTRVEAIAPEDYGKDGDSKTCEAARFQYHRADKTRSELIEMGFDRQKVEGLAQQSSTMDSERLARLDASVSSDPDESMEIVDLYECYLKVDIDGDGIAEICRIYYAGAESGGTILDWDEWEDETPFDDIPCEPMPHRWEARSVADETMDVQQIKTVLLRQGLDNTYATNNPQRFVTGVIKNPDELFSPSFGGAIFGDIGSTVTPLTVPFVAQHAYDGLNYQDQVIQKRTGVARQTMALDPDALQNQTATANQNERDANYSQVELIARNQAEYGWKKVFRKILKLEVKHQDQPRDIRMRGKFVKIDPRHWNADMDISINVGLGTGSRDRDMIMLQQVQQDQILIVGALEKAGMGPKALEMAPYMLETMTQKATAAGIRNPELFFPEVTEDDIKKGQAMLEEKAKQPPPEVQLEQMKIEAQGKADQQKLQVQAGLEGQKIQASAQAEQQKSQAQVMREAAQMQADLQTKEADRVAQQQAEAQKQAFEAEKFVATQQLERERMAEEARQKELDRQQAWALEMEKIAAADRAAERSAQQAVALAAMKPEPKNGAKNVSP